MRAKITWDDVRAMRRWRSEHPEVPLTYASKELARRYPLVWQQVYAILRNVVWHDPDWPQEKIYRPRTLSSTERRKQSLSCINEKQVELIRAALEQARNEGRQHNGRPVQIPRRVA